ncbi:MAG: ATP-dependent DNA helicase [Parcubacteria group bacterium]
MSKEIFNKFYKQLNPQQKLAVDSIEGPVMVIAGPGTGKTQVLTLRIANIIDKADINPENILALTFTESGVVSMRRRLAEIIGTPAYGVNISTFHGFANDVIKEHPEAFPEIISSNPATEMEQVDIMRDVIESAHVKELKPYGDPFHYLKPALGAIRDLKREGISPEQLDKLIIKEKKSFDSIDDLIYDKGPHKGKMKGKYQDELRQINKNKELVTLYKGYQKQLKDLKLYDYEDMVVEVLNAFEKDKDLLLTLQEQYHYFLVDEHQDTNRAQNRILELLASFHDNPNLFIVGDEKQAIFRFQGASLENFLYFKKLYKDAELIDLKTSYRSTQTILDSAQSLMKHRKPLPLKGINKYKEKSIVITPFATQNIEQYAIAKDIEGLIAEGTPAGNIAVLYRQNKEASSIAHMFGKVGVPFVIESDLNILEDKNIQKILKLLLTIQNYGDTATLLETLHIDFLNIDPLDIYSLAGRRINVFEIIGSLSKMKSLKLQSIDELHRLSTNLTLWSQMAHNEPLTNLFESIIRDSGLLESVLSKQNYIEVMDNVTVLFDQVQSLLQNNKNYSLDDFMRHIRNIEDHKVALKTRAKIHPVSKVHLMTAHRAKGLEFDYIFIVNVSDKHWGNRRRFSSFKLPQSVYSLMDVFDQHDENEDERNLFYVALTRAKKGVYISYADVRDDGREQLLSQFVQEIDAKLTEIRDGSKFEEMFKKESSIVFAKAKTKSGPDLQDKEYLQDLFKKRGFAVTHLNNYLDCPWKYFYVNLIRIPKAPEKSQIFGIAMHEALKDYFNHFKTGLDPGSAYLLKKFKKYLSEHQLSDMDMKELNDRGVKALSGYHKEYAKSWKHEVLNEFTVRGVELTSSIRLTGKMDKIEILNEAREVNVVDYKTGKPKTRGFIEGKTKSSNGDYKRQLVFYKILLNHYGDGMYNMRTGEIDFVEPDIKGKYKKEMFEITGREVTELEAQMKDVSDEILNLKFWNLTCTKKDCEFCRLRELMA